MALRDSEQHSVGQTVFPKMINKISEGLMALWVFNSLQPADTI